MLNKELLKEIIVSQKEAFLKKNDLFFREALNKKIIWDKNIKEIISITGLRRTGKSSLMRLIWDEYKKKEELSDDQFFYFNFEDERIIGFGVEDFSFLLDLYFELFSPDKSKKIFIFLDEVQNVSYWEKWLRRLYEEGKYKIFITGSNASLMSSELATSLTGRSLSLELSPLSFFEFYSYFKGYGFDKKSLYKTEEKVKIIKSFKEYFKTGGMPEYLKSGSGEIIQEYFRDIVLRDIVNRHNVKYKKELKELAHYLISNPGCVFSLKNLSKATEIKNINTIKNYLGYLEESYLYYFVPKFSFSYKEQIYSPDKVYFVDLAFFHNIAFNFSGNIGHLLENIVFLELRRNKNEIFYYKSKFGSEVDFLIKDREIIKNLIQVSRSITDKKTKERETESLFAAMDELKLKQSLILTEDEEEIIKKNKKEIIVKPIYKWLLEKEF